MDQMAVAKGSVGMMSHNRFIIHLCLKITNIYIHTLNKLNGLANVLDGVSPIRLADLSYTHCVGFITHL